MKDLRIVLLGKTGDGKSSTGNTILEEAVFHTGTSPTLVTRTCESQSKTLNGRKITVVDAPGFFDTSLPEKELNDEILRCITECDPGPHAFLIVLKLGRYTGHEMETLKQIAASFGEEALRYAVVLFTHGKHLSVNQTIENFVDKSTELQELVDKCGGRVHVIDNEDWNPQQDDYRSNRVQVENLLNTIEEMVRENGGQCYTNEMLQMVNRTIEEELKNTENEKQPKEKVHTKLSVRLVGVGTGVMLGALFCAEVALCTVMLIEKIYSPVSITGASTGTAAVGVAAVSAGAVAGGIKGYDAAEGVQTMSEAMDRAANATYDIAKTVKEKIQKFLNDE